MSKSVSKIITRFAICLIFAVTFFADISPVSADQYITHSPNGNIITDVNLMPGASPYTFPANSLFQAIAQIISFSTVTEKVTVTAQNNNSATSVVIIPAQNLPAGGFITPQYTSFTAPATVGSTYAVNFVTGLELQQPTLTNVFVRSICYNNNECDISLDASLDQPARPTGEHIDVVYSYSVCTTYGGCNSTTYSNTVSVDFAPGQQDINMPSTGQVSGEPQIQTYCVDPTSATVTVSSNSQC